MNVLTRIARPQYLFNPRQVWRRLRRRQLLAQDRVMLAWALPIRVQPTCLIATDIKNVGVFDMIVAEAICRLLDPGERAVDVGANIGQNTSIMALVAGPTGAVAAFEPHPGVWETLSANVERWRRYELATIQTFRQGLSSVSGTAYLNEPDGFDRNQGGATLVATAQPAQRHLVEVTTLDRAVPPGVDVGLVKIDVEGHEEAVLLGAQRLLGERRVRDILFEALEDDPRAARHLEQAGYTVFRLRTRMLRPRLIPWPQHVPRGTDRLPRNYLATRMPERACQRFEPFGWRCLRLRARKRGR